MDAHWRDPLEKLNYQSATYHHLLTSLQGLADELCGAYRCQSLSGHCVCTIIDTLWHPGRSLNEAPAMHGAHRL